MSKTQLCTTESADASSAGRGGTVFWMESGRKTLLSGAVSKARWLQFDSMAGVYLNLTSALTVNSNAKAVNRLDNVRRGNKESTKSPSRSRQALSMENSNVTVFHLIWPRDGGRTR